MIELSELRDAASKAFPADQIRPPRDAAWRLAAEMGWLMMPVAEEVGGLGLGRDATAAIVQEMGRVLGTAPLIPALMTVQALGSASELADQQDWIDRACAGEYIAMNLDRATIALGIGDVLDALLPAVPDADMASHTLVFGPDFCALVPLDAPGVTVTERLLWDESRRLFDVTVKGHAIAPGMFLAKGTAATEIGDRLRADLVLAIAADSLGGAAACLAMTVEYLKTRRQFDRPLAMFQALKHRCADLKIDLDAADALLWSRAADDSATIADIGAAKVLSSEIFRKIAEEAIQLHGGIGLTDEHNCHLFMKRAMLNLQLGGDLDVWRERVGRQALADYV
ncbi:MAG: acyl-CoA dehydrogenase family protein [Novosphingobium sp.]